MIEIDWSKAPEGATHWEPENGLVSASWMKLLSGQWYYWPLSSATPEWTLAPMNNTARVQKMLARPAPTEWSGTGLPPVGLVCDTAWDSDSKSYVTCKILAHDEDRAVFRFTSGSRKGEYGSVEACMLGSRRDVPQFRPIRTTEQIAAEERDAAIEDMYQIYKNSPGLATQQGMAALYDAGYRKQEQTK